MIFAQSVHIVSTICAQIFLKNTCMLEYMCYTTDMDISTHRKILAQMYGCREDELLDRFKEMTPQIRNSAIVTLSIQKKVDKPVGVMA